MLNKTMTVKVFAVFLVAMALDTPVHAYGMFWDGPHQVYQLYQTFPGDYNYPYIASEPLAELPAGAITIVVAGTTYYYHGGVFYQRNIKEQKYVIVPPPIGAVVYDIPEGYQLMMVGNVSYYVSNGVYYARVLDGYKVIEPPVSTFIQTTTTATVPSK